MFANSTKYVFENTIWQRDTSASMTGSITYQSKPKTYHVYKYKAKLVYYNIQDQLKLKKMKFTPWNISLTDAKIDEQGSPYAKFWQTQKLLHALLVTL